MQIKDNCSYGVWFLEKHFQEFAYFSSEEWIIWSKLKQYFLVEGYIDEIQILFFDVLAFVPYLKQCLTESFSFETENDADFSFGLLKTLLIFNETKSFRIVSENRFLYWFTNFITFLDKLGPLKQTSLTSKK